MVRLHDCAKKPQVNVDMSPESCSSLQSKDSEISFDNSRVRSSDWITAVGVDVPETVCVDSVTRAVFTGTFIDSKINVGVTNILFFATPTFFVMIKEPPPSANVYQTQTLGGTSKMYSYCSNNLLNIKDVFIKKVVHADSFVKVFIKTPSSPQTCPCCGLITKRVHDYRLQTIKDLPFQTKHCFLVLRKRRYSCSCGKKLYENYSFLPRYLQITSRLTAFIADSFHEQQNIVTIARKANVSTATVNRILDTIHFPKMKLPEVLSNDERQQECDLMLMYNDDLRKAHYLKEKFYEICQNPKYSEQRTDFWDWVSEAERCDIPECEKCAKIY